MSLRLAAILVFMMFHFSLAHAEVDALAYTETLPQKPAKDPDADNIPCEDYLVLQIMSLWDLEMYLRLHGARNPWDN